MTDSRLIFVSGLLLTGAAVLATHWHDRAHRLQDAIEYMVQDDIDDGDIEDALKLWGQE